MDLTQQLFAAAMAKFAAQREEAKAILMTYFTNSVGIGDHSNHLDEIAKWTKALAEAEECLITLQKNFLQKPPDPIVEE
jgi:ABC-type uncharacterized transport system fused permease/ATPase subunit